MTQVLVRHMMSAPVVTFFAEQTVPLADDVMRLHHFRHLPVIDDGGRLLGLVSQRDLLRSHHRDVRVADIMTRDVWTVRPGAPASVAGQTLLDHVYGCLPVVDDAGVLVGIITERDFVRFGIKTLEMYD